MTPLPGGVQAKHHHSHEHGDGYDCVPLHQETVDKGPTP
jgi:hypothetical protein